VPHRKNHAISTKNNIKGIELRWKNYDISTAHTLWIRVLTNMQIQHLSVLNKFLANLAGEFDRREKIAYTKAKAHRDFGNRVVIIT
jgi:hypothetical protein